LIAASDVNCVRIDVKFAPTRVRFAETVARLTLTRESGEPTCVSYARIGAMRHHGRTYVPTVRRSAVTPASCGATGETFEAMFAIGAAMSVSIDTIGATRGESE
jgi:hypothetical protein